MHSCEEEEEREREGIIMTSEESGRNEKQCPPLLLIQLNECMQTERLSLMHPLSCGTDAPALSRQSSSSGADAFLSFEFPFTYPDVCRQERKR